MYSNRIPSPRIGLVSVYSEALPSINLGIEFILLTNLKVKNRGLDTFAIMFITILVNVRHVEHTVSTANRTQPLSSKVTLGLKKCFKTT